MALYLLIIDYSNIIKRAILSAMDWLSILATPYFKQVLVLCTLALGLTLFIKGRIRYDVVSLLLIIIIIAFGILTPNEAFANFGHPAIIIVASMFVMGEALVRSGVVDAITGRLGFLYTRPMIGLGVLVIVVTLLSSFVNNAGALAIVAPVAVHLARKSRTSIALFLLPLAFASHLGGFMTLIGTPRNIIISDFRADVTGTPFAMFDFLPVGGLVALAGVLFLIIISWRMIPQRKSVENEPELTRSYLTEVTVPPHSHLITVTIERFEEMCSQSIKVIGIHRDSQDLQPISTLEIDENDRLLLQGEIEALTFHTERLHLGLTGMRAKEGYVTNEDEQITMEVLVPTYARIIGQNWNDIALRERFGVNFIGISRRNNEIASEIDSVRFWPNDFLLLHGRRDSIEHTIQTLRLMAIANSEVPLGRTLRIVSVLAILGSSIAIATLNIFPLAVIFLITSVILVLFNLVSLRQAYESIDQTVLILLAGMITLGEALQRSGAAETIAHTALQFGDVLGPVIMLCVILLFTIFLSDFMNTTASAVTMAPIAILIAQNLNVSVDTFLMAVAIGASCAFLTPIGHESNAMVMKQGGYTFKDYFKVGLPLELIIISTSIPLILHFWPLYG